MCSTKQKFFFFVVVVSCGVLDVFLLGGFLSRHVCDLC